MKKLFTLVAASAMALGMSAQSITISKVDEGLANDYAAGCEIDIDNDGIKELVIGGSPNWPAEGSIGQVIYDADGNEVKMESRCSWILKFNGTDYEATQLSQEGVIGIRSHVIPADFNGDGNVDIYIASGGDANTLNGIFLNDGNGSFVKDDTFKVLNEDGEPIVDEETGTQLRWLPRAIDVADFNNDGLVDIVSCGWWLGANSETAMNGVLINQGDGTYKVTNRFLIGIEDEEYAYPMALCTIKAFDLNNDGYADFMVQGNVDGEGAKPETKNGVSVGRTFMAFLNIGADGPGEFYDLGLAQGVSHTFGNGNFNVVDFNNDGTPDIFVTGESPDDARGGGQWEYYPQLLIGKITKSADGNEVSYTDNSQFPASHKDIRPLNSSNNGTRAIDYNGDGLYDLFYLGWSTQMLDNSDWTQVGWFFPGSANGLTSYQRIPGASEQGVFFLDYGVEGDLNYTFTGFHGDGNYFGDATGFASGRSMVFTKNPWTVARRPEAPTAPKAEVDDHTVTLSWTAPAAEKKNVTYEYFLKKDGKVYNACTSFIGGDKDGVRKVLREGNAYMNTSITLNLADGDYEWGVQTINAAEKGSVFAKGETFRVGAGSGIFEKKAAEAVEVARYNAAGQAIAAQKGLNIVKMSDGTVQRVIVK
jgi:hypothetical protein